jgi:hyperosmotically inducible periplasmic protein
MARQHADSYALFIRYRILGASMTSRTFTIATLAACLVLCAQAVAARPHDGTLTSEDVDNTAVNVDNTAANKVDAHDSTSTPTDHSNSTEARQTTANIRKALMADKTLSVSGHNVKIVTNGSTVTLRGPVASAAEKERIAALARQNAPGKDVVDQLTVKGA